MLKKITLINFMSHRETVIEPAAGLTVIAGDNNCGKSAIVAAIQCVCANATGHYMVRHGEKECRVILETDDGHEVEWKRANRKVSYVVDGETIDRTRGKVPEKVERALRMGVVEAENEEFDIHFADQKSPVFLLDGSPAERAAFFASSSDASKLIEMQTLHKAKVAEAQRQVKDLNQRETELLARLEILQPVDELQLRIQQAEKNEAEVKTTEESIQKLDRLVNALMSAKNDVSHFSVQSKSLAKLGVQPKFSDTKNLENTISQITESKELSERSKSLRTALQKLPAATPQFVDCSLLERSQLAIKQTRKEISQWQAATKLLELPECPSFADLKTEAELIAELKDTLSQVSYLKNRLNHLQKISPMPTANETETLAKQIVGQSQAVEEIKELQQDLAAVSRQTTQAHTALHEALEESGACPTCGQELKVSEAGQ